MHRCHCLQSCAVLCGVYLNQAAGTLDLQDFGSVKMTPVLPIRRFECRYSHQGCTVWQVDWDCAVQCGTGLSGQAAGRKDCKALAQAA